MFIVILVMLSEEKPAIWMFPNAEVAPAVTWETIAGNDATYDFTFSPDEIPSPPPANLDPSSSSYFFRIKIEIAQ